MNDVILRSSIESGLRAHRQGDFATAQAAYQRVLSLAPDHPDALNLLGTLLLQQDQAMQAIEYLQRAAQTQRNHPGILGNLAQAYLANGDYEKAQETFRKASRLQPREIGFQLGNAHALAMQGKLAEAEALLVRMLERFPHEASVWFNLGNVRRDQLRTTEALECYRRALEFDPGLIDARNNLASVLHGMQFFEEAAREFRICIQTAPNYLLARCNLASVLIDLGRFSDAEQLCRELIDHVPNLALAHTFLGAAVGHQGRMLDALQHLRMAAELAPQDAKAVETFAAALMDTGYFSDGFRRFAQTLELNPASISAHQMLGSALLAHGRLADGWTEYTFRPAAVRFREKTPHITLSTTLPSDIAGQHLCILREQGLGDEIFFLRYLPQLHAAGARITYRASNKISGLVKRIPGITQVLEETATPPQADAYILVGDLPNVVSSSAASPVRFAGQPHGMSRFRDFPSRTSIFWPPVPPPLRLAPYEERIDEMTRRLAMAGSPPYLGLTWRAGTPPQEQKGVAWTLHKEIGMDRLAAALRHCPGTFIALQRRPVPGELESLSATLGRQAHDFTDLNEDLEGMLALLALIDEYIGVSNTNTHLRAGVGKAARVLVPCPADWRWMHAGRHSPWFPQFPIYRQSLQGDWDGALARLAGDLEADLQAPATAQDRS